MEFNYRVKYLWLQKFYVSPFVTEKTDEICKNEQKVKAFSDLSTFLEAEISSKVQQFNMKIPPKSADFLRYVTFNVGSFSVNADNENTITRSKWNSFLNIFLPSIDADVLALNQWPSHNDKILIKEMNDLGYDLATSLNGSKALFIKSGLKYERIDSELVSGSFAAQLKLFFQDREIFVVNTNFVEASLEEIFVDLKGAQHVIFAGESHMIAPLEQIQKYGLTEVSFSPIYTHFDGKSMVKSDYIFQRGLRPIFHGVYHSNISDHLPVIADFTFDSQSELYKNNKYENSKIFVKERIYDSLCEYGHYRPSLSGESFRKCHYMRNSKAKNE